MEDFKQYLSQVMQYEATGNGKKGWLFATKKDAVSVANYLRSHGYTIHITTYKSYYLQKWGFGFYVSVILDS